MTHRLRFQKIGSSKVYEPNCLSIPQDNDHHHQKIWNQKTQQAKHIQQQKQIDRMLHGIVKQRLFGHFISQQTRISDQGYYHMEKTKKNIMNPISLPKRKISPLKGLKDYNINPRKKMSLHKTIDVSDLSMNKKNSTILRQTKYSSNSDNWKQRKPYIFRSLNILNYTQFPNHFRQLANNATTMLYDIKITKQSLFKYNKQHKIVSQTMLQKFLYFFNFSGAMNIKQYGKWIQNIGNCSMRESSFFTFQALDQSHNGFLTISDLFRALQNMPDNPQLQKQVYELMSTIQKFSEELDQADLDYRQIKPTIQQILVRNPQIRLQSLRQLLKQSSKELVPGNCVKSTTYHISLLALEHDSATRQKLSKLQQNSNRQKNKRQQEFPKKLKQDGIRYKNYAQVYEKKRSKIYLLILEMCLGSKIQIWD